MLKRCSTSSLLATLLTLGLLAGGCAGGGNTSSSGFAGPGGDSAILPGLGRPAPVNPAVVTKQSASAVVITAIGGGSVAALLPKDGKIAARVENPGGDTTSLPTLDINSPNGAGLAAAMTVALKGGGSITSPLGGSCTIVKGKSSTVGTFAALKTPTGILDGEISVNYTLGGPADDVFIADVQFNNLNLTANGRTLTYDGPARLHVSSLLGLDDIRWRANFSVQEAAASRSLTFQDFETLTNIHPGGAKLTMSGRISVDNINGVTGRVTVETLDPLEFSGAVGSQMSLLTGKMLVQGDRVVTLEAPGVPTLPGSHENTLTVLLGAEVLKVVSWSYLGGDCAKLDALRPLLASTILRNANIITLNDAQPRAQALAVRDGRILRVGSETEVAAFQGPATEVVDMKGKTLLPGFVEPHMHYDLTSLHISATQNTLASGKVIPANTQLVECGLYDENNPAVQVKTKAQVVTALTNAVTANPNADAIFGFNFDPTRLDGADKFQNLTLQDLDKISATIPIVVQNASGHITYANSAAFRKAKVNSVVIWPTAPNAPYSAPAPPFVATNIVTAGTPPLPTGQMNEDAQAPFLEVAIAGALQVGINRDFTAAKAVHWLENWRTMQEQVAARGVTTAVDILMGANSSLSLDGEAEVTGKLEARPDCPTRARIYVNGQAPIDNINVFAGEGNARMRFVGAKVITDGSTQGLTAGLNFNYLTIAGVVFPVGPTGLVDFVDSAALLTVIQPFYQRGFQLCFHTNGDRAFDIVKGALKMLPADIKTRRTRLEHFTVHQNISAGGLATHVADCLELGLYPGHTIGHVFYWGQVFNQQILGPDVSQNIDPVGAEIAAGIKVSMHSDCPITPVFPLLYVQTAVTRFLQVPPGGTPSKLGPQHAVDAIEALKCISLYPAEAAFSEQEIGSLEEGKYADVVVLAQDPTAGNLANDPNGISKIQVLSTRLAGQLVSGANP